MKYHDIEIHHDNVIPLHEQLTNQIRQLILSRRWTTGYRVPSETELQRRLSISRSTVRHSLQTIEIEGLIERVAGRGTFVTPLRDRDRVHSPLAFMVIDFDHPQQRELLRGAESAAREAGLSGASSAILTLTRLKNGACWSNLSMTRSRAFCYG